MIIRTDHPAYHQRMIRVELRGGFHDGKQWDVLDLHTPIHTPVLQRFEAGAMPAMTMVTYRWTGEWSAAGLPIYGIDDA